MDKFSLDDKVSISTQEALELSLESFNKKDYHSSWSLVREIVNDGSSSNLLFFAGNILYQMGDFEVALSYYLKGFQKNNADDELIYSLASCYLKLGFYLKAEELFLDLRMKHPSNLDVIDGLILIYDRKGAHGKKSKLKKEREAIERTRFFYEERILNVIDDCEILVSKKDYETAKVLLQNVLLINSVSPKANLLYAEILYYEECYVEAVSYFRRVGDEFYSSKYALIFVSSLIKVGEFNSAILFLERIRSELPGYFELEKELGVLYYHKREYKNAYKCLNKVSKHYSDDAEFITLKALSKYYYLELEPCWLDAKKLDDAVEDLYFAHTKKPHDQSITFAIFNYFNIKGEYREALDFLNSSFVVDLDLKEFRKTTYYYAKRDTLKYYKSFIRGRKQRLGLKFFDFVKDKIWNGGSLEGKKVLILREQGIGDEISVAHNYRWVINQAREVDIICSSRLKGEFSRLFPEVNFISEVKKDDFIVLTDKKVEAIEAADVIVMGGDIFRWLYEKEGLTLFDENYYKPVEWKKKYWQKKLNSLSMKPKVGIIWRSGVVNMQRSVHYLKLEEVCKIINAIEDVDFISCMYDYCKKDLKYIKHSSIGNIHHFDELDQRNDFESTASMLSCLDLVIGPFTAPLTLAAAIGVPIISCGGDYLEEDGVLLKQAFKYENVPHISIPILNSDKRNAAVELFIEEIKNKLYLKR